MRRRRQHQGVLIGVTILFFGFALYFSFAGRDLPKFFIACGAYTGFLLVYSFACWLDVPRHLRRRPSPPPEFLTFRIGLVGPHVVASLADAQITKDQVFGGVRHQLFLLERAFDEGTWRCHVEKARDEILAYEISFKSIASPVLDTSEQRGNGRFLVVPG